jgi:2'-5' RNA ligase
VQTVSKFRGDCVCEDYLKPGRAYNKNQDAMLATYGNPFVMDQYFPHISLGFIKDRSSQLEKIRLNLLEQVRVKEFPINNLQLVGSEENGHKVIQVIQLSL